MYLSHIEILGFKSFAQKTNVKFNTGMTAIVGPNGCGKTNVVDAIRWVLGEQKASTLRSDKMYDVIFNGTKSRRPLGLAEVSLIIDNNRNVLPTEYTQIKLTRRLFRSGESQYLMNGTECRLRDINDLFMDTGMGPDAYSVIELKMIETILSNRTDERRRLFEEAAGVTKYKSRRKEAERRLEAVQGDLTRIQDIVSEVQKTVRSLSRQAAKAKLAAEIKQKYSRVERAVMLIEYAALVEQIKPLQARIEAERATKERLENDINDQEYMLAELQREQDTIEQRLGEAENAYADANQHVAFASKELAVADERLIALQRSRERLLREAVELRQTVEQTSIRLEECRLHKESLASEFRSAENDFSRAKILADEMSTHMQSVRGRVRSANDAVMTTMNQINAVRATSERTIASINALQRRIEETDRMMQQNQERAASLHREYESALARLVEFDHAVEDAQSELQTAQEEQQSLQSTIDATKQEIASLQAEFSRKSASLEFLQGLVSSAESGQFLMDTPTWQPAQRLILADAFDADAPIRIALESALGDAAQYFVVETAQEAAAGMAALRDGGKGKATFVCLERVPSVEAPSNVTTNEGVLGWASELVRLAGTDERLRWVLRGLLGKMLVVQSLEIAQNLVSQGIADAAVSLNGEVVSKSGMMRGGGTKPSEGAAIGKREHIEQLQREIAELQTSIEAERDELNTNITQLREIDVKRLSEALRQAETAKNKHEQTVAQLDYQQRSLEEAMESRQSDIEKFRSEIRSLEEAAQTQGASGVNDLDKLQHEKLQAEQDLAITQTALHNAEEQFSLASDDARKAELALVQFRNDERTLASEIQRLEQECISLDKRIADREREAESTVQEAETLQDRANELSSSFEALQHEAQEALLIRNAIAQEQAELRKRLAQQNEELRSVRREYESLTAKVHEYELQLTNLSNRADGYRTRAQEEFTFDIDNPPPEEPMQETIEEFEALFTISDSKNSLDALKSESKALKSQIQSIGTVNPLAYEEYENESQRLEFLETQFKDLQESEHTLKHTIQEINQTAQKQFYDVFERIRTNFISIFTSLFNEGDEADLQIEEGDPLEAAIRITAKPRGKRPSSIDMLSGGEKTLTAIALLFAIYLVKPSPFCILDEVDAPLDDANIDRYIRLIRKFSESTQFIMITHNKLTMEAAETLYGVTMEEEGVSKVVSVRFSEYERKEESVAEVLEAA